MKKEEHPVDKDRWEQVLENVRRNSIVHRIAPFTLALEYWSGIRAYYGSGPKALLALGRFQLARWWNGVLTRITLVVTDGFGWTKVYFYPGTEAMPAFHRRHGRQCSGSPNCDDQDCINRAIPGWFKLLSRWED